MQTEKSLNFSRRWNRIFDQDSGISICYLLSVIRYLLLAQQGSYGSVSSRGRVSCVDIGANAFGE